MRSRLLYAGNAEPQLGIDRPAEPGLGAPSALFVYLATHAVDEVITVVMR